MKTVVITGSTKGIGRGLAVEFLKRNCRVVICGRNKDRLSRVKGELAEEYGADQVEAVTCDVTDFSQVEALWNKARERFKKVDIWINNAGITHSPGEFRNLDESSISKIVQTNITGLLYGCKAALNGMNDQGCGAVYNLEGLGSDGRMVKGVSVYGMTKRAVNYITQALTRELKNSSIIVGAIYPGMVVTDLLTSDLETMDVDFRTQTEKSAKISNINNRSRCSAERFD